MDRLKKLIQENDIISFDVFDTLIKRDVKEPKDIFSIVEWNFNKGKMNALLFRKLRIDSEAEARKSGPYREVNLDEIYDAVAEKIGKAEAKELESLEVSVEMAFCHANPIMVEYFKYAVSLGKRVFVISDMYLPGKIIEKLLKKNNIEGFEKVYSSCDLRVTKWDNGQLYKSIIQENRLENKSILHIGNDYKADYQMALKCGLHAFLYKSALKKSDYCSNTREKQSISYACLKSFICNHIGDNQNRDFDIGFSVFGPLLYSYLMWLKKLAKENDVNQILFVSRDGYILKRGFDLVCSDITSKYFYGSRRAIILPVLQYDKDLSKMLSHYKSWGKYVTIREVFKRIGIDLSHEDYQRITEKLGILPDKLLSTKNIQENPQVCQLYSAVKGQIYDKSFKQFEILSNYLKKEKVAGKTAISDIGGGCTIEYALREFLEKANRDVELFGYYLFTNQDCNNHRQSFFNLNSSSELRALFRICSLFLEVFLSAPHGTVLEYDYKNGGVIPQMGEYMYSNRKEDQEKIRNLQEGALDFVRLFHHSLGNFINLSFEDAIANFKKFGITPTYKDAVIWGDFMFDSDTFSPMAKPQLINVYLSHPKQLIRDFRITFWPGGFLVRLFRSSVPSEILFRMWPLIEKVKNIIRK